MNTVEEVKALIAENNAKRLQLDTEIETRKATLAVLNREAHNLELTLHELTRPARDPNAPSIPGDAKGAL